MKTLTATLHFKQADKFDLIESQKKLRLGKEYWVLNQDLKTLSGKHTINQDTDANELAAWFKAGRVYVLESCLDKKICINKKENED